jgi:L-asparaginase II
VTAAVTVPLEMLGPKSPEGAPPDVELARVYRSGLHEGSHYGALVITDSDGSVLWQRGDAGRPVFHRSCAKPFQAAAMLDAGLPLTGPQLALAAASHSGEPDQVAGVLSILAGADLTEDDLGCPADLPADQTARAQVLRAGGTPRRVYMNCSGKHAAMLQTCRINGWSSVDYLDPKHPLQQHIRATIEAMTGAATHPTVGVDGCGAPVFATNLVDLARGYGALVTAPPGTSARAVANAMLQSPYLVGGTTSVDTLLMTGVDGLLVKLGADGVQAFALPDGRAAAFKISDGADRARLPLVLAALEFLGIPTGAVASSEAAVTASTVLGGGRSVGSIVVAPNLFG